MNPPTAQDRINAASYLIQNDKQALPRILRALASDVETLTRAPSLSYLGNVESSVSEIRRRLTRIEAFNDILP